MVCKMKLHVFLGVWAALPIMQPAGTKQLYMLGKTEYAIIFTNFTECPAFTKEPFLTDINFYRHRNYHYVSGYFHVPFDSCVKLLRVKIYRCQGHKYACEYFQTWNITEFCTFVRMRNTMWTPLEESVRPRNWLKTCPCVKKGSYSISNGTVDINEVVRFYPEAVNYYWQIQIDCFDTRHDKATICAFITFHLLSYNTKIPVRH